MVLFGAVVRDPPWAEKPREGLARLALRHDSFSGCFAPLRAVRLGFPFFLGISQQPSRKAWPIGLMRGYYRFFLRPECATYQPGPFLMLPVLHLKCPEEALP